MYVAIEQSVSVPADCFSSTRLSSSKKSGPSPLRPACLQPVGLTIAFCKRAADSSGVYGIVKTVFSVIFLLWFIDRIGRRPSFVVGAGVMGTVMLINACPLATHPPQANSDTVSSYSIAMIVMIYVYCIGYSWSWGTVPWTYVGCVCHQRQKGASSC